MIEAKYTKLFKDWLDVVDEGNDRPYYMILKDTLSHAPFNNDMGTDLYNMIINVFRYYEIGSENDNEFYLFMVNSFYEYVDFYYELIINYKKEYNYALNNKRVITKSDKLNIEGNTQISNEQDGSNTRYDLPNKVVPSSNWRSTPSDITDTKDSSVNNKDYSNETTRDSTTTTEFNNEFIDLKNKYINQIRNVYREFAMKFKDCFYQIY